MGFNPVVDPEVCQSSTPRPQCKFENLIYRQRFEWLIKRRIFIIAFVVFQIENGGSAKQLQEWISIYRFENSIFLLQIISTGFDSTSMPLHPEGASLLIKYIELCIPRYMRYAQNGIEIGRRLVSGFKL